MKWHEWYSYSLPFLLMQWYARICFAFTYTAMPADAYLLNGYAWNGYVWTRVLNGYVLLHVLHSHTLPFLLMHSFWTDTYWMDTDWEDMCRMMLLDMTVVQKSCIQILNLGFHNRHIYMIFHFPLCGVTQGNPAKHKLGARFRQGWRKCFHALSWYILIYLQFTSEGF